VRADGRIIWVRDSTRVQTENDGKARTIYGLVTDITERKQAELEREWLTTELRNINQTLDERVRARTAELQAILDAVGEGIVVTDLNGIIQYVNPTLAKLTGYQEQETIGRTPRLWRSDKQSSAFYTNMWQTIRTGQTWRGELVNKRRDGSLYDSLLTITPISGLQGQPVGFVGVQSDITPFKQMDRLKSEFISMAAHELRTPLTSILGFSEILLTRQLPEDRRNLYLKFINQQALGLRAILDDLLDLARLEAGEGFEMTETLVDLKEIFTETIFGFQENYPKHQYHIKGPETWPQINGDPVKLAQFFKNLLSNATKYSPNGGNITLEAQVEENYGWLHLTLTDEGIGMTPEQVAQVFERFYRADASNTAIGGTGLGMTITRLIIERHGGKIWVESQYGRGTTVHILLPLLNRPTYILIIEDDQGLRELQKRVLGAEGFTMLSAEEGESGLNLAKACLPNLILLDLALPGIAGFEVLERLQSNHLTKAIPVVITSAIDTATEIEKAIEKGASDYLVKPYGMGDLTIRVNRALAQSSMRVNK
jgi:PAS domain S-box-containing protein